MKKRIFATLLCGAMVLGLSACTVTGSKDTPPTSPLPQQSETIAPGVSAEPSSAPVVAPVDPVALEASGSLGDYSAEIKDFVLAKDYTNNPAIVITYAFTNNSEKATSAMIALNGTAYQNGVQLGTAMVIDDKVYSASNSMLEIKTGGSLDVQVAYSLTSETAPVEFELRELISFSDNMLGKTFEIAPGGVTELATIDVPADAAIGTIDDFEISIISMAKSKDYEDKDCISVVYGFKNNGTESECFTAVCADKAYQDSVQLKAAFVTSSAVSDALNPLIKVKPGAAILITQSYYTTSTSDVEVEVSKIFGSGSETVKRTFTLE